MLVSVLVGAELAGVLGALAAIPVAGSIQVIVRDHARPAPAARARPVLAESRPDAEDAARIRLQARIAASGNPLN